MLPENRSFWIRGDDGHEYGPVDLAELREWVAENRAGLGTEVRHDDNGSAWYPWQNYPELVALLAEVQVTSPVPDQPGLVIAPLGRRFLAMVVDFILCSILVSPILYAVMTLHVPDWESQFTQMLLQPQNPIPDQLHYYVILSNVISYTVMALYMAGFHAAHGKTPAKSFLRIRVVDENGRKPGLIKASVRALIMVLSVNLLFLPFIYIFFNPQRRAFHDLIAGTYVVEA